MSACTIAALCLGLAGNGLPGDGFPGEPENAGPTPAPVPAYVAPGPGWVPVEPARLARMRGGFVTASGLSLSFAVQRSVHVDGVLVSYVHVDIPDVARITPSQAEELARLSRAQVLQLGSGNLVQSGSGAGFIVQNAMDNRHIQVQTTVDTAVNTLGLLQAINAADALTSALTGARGGP